jgi:hypothetical protein
MLSQVLCKTGSENAQGCAQNAENGFGFDFFERYRKEGDEFLSHVATADETWVSFEELSKERSRLVLPRTYCFEFILILSFYTSMYITFSFFYTPKSSMCLPTTP